MKDHWAEIKGRWWPSDDSHSQFSDQTRAVNTKNRLDCFSSVHVFVLLSRGGLELKSEEGGQEEVDGQLGSWSDCLLSFARVAVAESALGSMSVAVSLHHHQPAAASSAPSTGQH